MNSIDRFNLPDLIAKPVERELDWEILRVAIEQYFRLGFSVEINQEFN
ncbi:MAG TPA: hypothetical protein PK129_17225 [Cellvibrionaceae bacterium]|nr:hypothetical protein [Cellvibrionaceae bacterium]